MFTAARWRLVAWNVSVLTLLLLILGGAVYAYFSHSIYTELDNHLKTKQEQVLASLPNAGWLTEQLYANDANFRDAEYPAFVTSPNLRQLYVSTQCMNLLLVGIQNCPSDSLIPPSRDAMRAALKRGSDLRTVWVNNEAERLLTFTTPIPNGSVESVVQITHSATGEENALHELRVLLLVGGGMGIVIAALVSLFLANRALVPIREAFGRQRQFTADASHELRTPLALIRANAEMMGRHHPRAEDVELIDEIINETDHLNRLVSDLLTLARADTQSLNLMARPVDLRKLVADVHEDLSVIAQSRGISSAAQLNGAVTINGDEGRLRQLLLILLDNAIKYTDPGGRVTISLSRADKNARLVVEDTGIGIPDKDLEHIYERFFRVDRAREHESGGTGLGLSIAQWIVQAHAGTIRAESKLGRGTRFQIDLPLGTARASA